MNWKKRYYQLLDSLQRRKTRGGREPRERQPRSRAQASPRQAPARGPRPVQVRSFRTGRTSRPRLRLPVRSR